MDNSLSFFLLSFTSLLAIVNPLSAVPMYLAMTVQYDAARRASTLRRGIITALLVLLAFALLGNWILRFFGITTNAFMIAGGIIFFGIGWDMLQAKRSGVKTTRAEESEGAIKDDIGITPLGLPTLAGPGAMTTVIALLADAHTKTNMVLVYVAIVLTLLISWIVLGLAPLVVRRVGQTGLNVMTRIMGLLVTVIGVQFVINGTTAVVRSMLAP
jgi:multiple antibiotic resistance protein